jgi:antitoxin component YwqK of YwqJK toxin-antitoxin module
MHFRLNFIRFLFLPLIPLWMGNALFAQGEFSTKHDSINWVDSKGMKQGKFRKTDKDGKPIYEGYFRNNKPYGRFRYFDEDGKLTALSVFSKDAKSCNTTMYHRNGAVWARGKYVPQQRDSMMKDSIWTIYSSDSFLVARDSYKLGKKNGLSITYFSTGIVVEQTTFKDGIKDGSWKEFYPDGQMKGEGTYVNGCLEGIVYYYCEEGQIRIQCVYHNCLPHGQWLFYKCGSKKVDHIIVYKNGVAISGGIDVDKLEKEGLEQFKDRNEQEHQGGPGKEDKDGGN